MHFPKFLSLAEVPCHRGRWRTPRLVVPWRQVCAGLIFAAAFACIAQDEHSRSTATQAAGATPPATASAVAQSGDGTKPAQQDNERKRQISNDSTHLLAMAVALKSEVDKTNKDVLSLNVIRKADEIEKLARTVKERMKQSSGPG